MTASGTYAYAPGTGDLVLQAYSRIGIRRTAIAAEHMADARQEANLLQIEWANRGPNLWTVDLQSIPLVQGTATYSVDPTTITILDTYIETTSGGTTINRVILPIGRSDYAALPNKTTQAVPTIYWFNRQISPTVTLWQVPDSTSATLKFYRFRQVQDATLPGGLTPEVPQRWLDAFVASLAHRLARIYALPIEAARAADAERAYSFAATQDTETNVAMTIQPMTSGYFR